MSTPPMFDLEPTKPLTKPRAAVTGTGKIAYSNYRPTHQVACDDCRACQLEANVAGRDYPVAHKARFRRTQGGQYKLLCAEHRDLRKADEARELLEAELAAGGP